MASCLYECLCEAELQKYYPHFTALGFQKIDELAKVSMKDYTKLGVHNMKDRKRLFQLIRIIKTLQAEEAVRKEEEDFQKSTVYLRPQLARSGPRRQLHFDSLSEEKDGGKEFAPGLCTLSHSSSNESKDESAAGFSHDSAYQRLRKDFLKEPAIWTEGQLVAPASSSPNSIAPLLGDTDVSFVQRVAHNSGYNYGVPHSSIRANAAERETPWTETDKIRVCVRKRPLGVREERRGEVNILIVEDKETLLLHEKKEAVDLTQYVLQHVFYFDEVFGETCSNQDVYKKTAHPLIQHVFSGGNATCFAYGQTGAGKTYTMFGTHKNPGLYALAAKEIFRQLETPQARKDLHVWISFYEIYCGQLYDLLNGRKRLFAREDSKHIVQIVGLREVQVNTVNLLLEVILKGGKERSTGATGVNSDSSRSHAIIQIQIKDAANRVFGRISFIDLAGSERAADAKDSDRQTKMEGAEINQSLLALKECIRALDQEHAHTPFRQSKLTQVLKDSFVGNSKTCMIANVSPSHIATEHTLNTLRYADRVKELKRGMKCCTPTVNRRRATGSVSPKRIQNSPYMQVGGKSSPKKVKLGLQHPLMPTPAPKMKTSLLFQPARLPFSSTPKGQGRKEQLGAPWLGCTSPVKGILKTEPSAKKLAAEPTLHSEKSHLGKDFMARREGGREDRQRVKCLKVEPVQKQLVSRADFSHHNSEHPLDLLGEDGRPFAEQCTAAWTSVSPHQKDREQHLRLYHQQFQQPPLLQQKLNYQPLEKFLAQYKPQEIQVTQEAPRPVPVSPQCRDETMQLEELDDSDFSEDSFSPGPGQKAADVEAKRKCNQNSFFLHPRDRGVQEQDAQDGQELFCKWYESEKKGAALLSEEESTSYEEGGKSPSDWSSEERSALGSSLNNGMPEKPYCSEEDSLMCNRINCKELLVEQKQLRRTGPSHGCPDEHFSAPRKETQSPPLAAILLEPTFSGTTENKHLPERADFCGALDFPVDLADDLMTPLTVSFLNSGSVDIEGKEMKQSPTSSIHEINHWRRKAGQVLSPQAKYKWLSQPCHSPHDSSLLGATSAVGELHSCVCGYASEDPLADFLPRHIEESTLLHGNLQTSERSTILRYDSDPNVPKITVSWSCSDRLGLGKEEVPEPLAPCSPADKGEISSVSNALSSSDGSGNEQRSERSALSDLCLGTVELSQSEEAFRDEETGPLQNRHNHEATEQDPGADSKGATAGTAKNSLSACGQVDLAEGSLKDKEVLGRQLVLQNHQEQLDEMAALCSQEESLISKMPDLEFEDCLMKLDEILQLKAECIQRTRTQLQLFFAAPSSGATLLPVSST
ncbi:kinesin-like protein KIF24 [Candoia aspera]|uniref:kinesin-like protein KIF24 n=1 Tax=Candoia aspera TaxID=51853 RepID=UPI002FD81340